MEEGESAGLVAGSAVASLVVTPEIRGEGLMMAHKLVGKVPSGGHIWHRFKPIALHNINLES